MSPAVNNNARGFTLIEVLVALAIIAIALAAFVKAAGAGAANASYLRDKTFAHWIAANRFAEMQALNKFPGRGSDDGKTEMAGREWYWTVETEETPQKDMRRVNIKVRLQDDKDVSPLTILTGYLQKPLGGGDAAIRSQQEIP